MEMLVVLGVIMVVMFALNFPMYLALIVPPLIVLMTFFPNVEPYLIIQQLIAGVSTQVLLAVPLFIFAADIMSSGQISGRLLDLVEVFVGHIRGGLAITTVAACTFFGAISGSTQATLVAIGRPMYGRLDESGYKNEDSLALIESSSIIALLIPPSISMIMYCVVTGTSVADLFISGVVPGLIMLFLFSVYSYFLAKKNDTPRTKKATLKEIKSAFKNGLAPLGFPIIIFVGIFLGLFSPTEAAAISVLYAIICEVFLFKSVKFKDFKDIALSSGVVTTAVFVLVAAGALLSWVISYARLPQFIAELVLGTNPSALRVLITTTIFFFVAGMFVDSLVAIVILTPIFYAPAVAAGVDPIQLGILIVLQAAIASVSPPFGCNIFTASAVFEQPYAKVVRKIPIYLVILLVVTVLIIAFPQISTFLIS
ncbi:TRAP transporter large permease [Schnuerera sp. xch1]|uniref:TRAP transporter large permease n=1 Tax=Schnuerera sp. xch1 TaxID=2874283 RepID=UPI001CC1220A|nr:TRAP transporter large permease [Schnuerera sp. xch1]MBZ2174161.1 TRAP transporter large permease [Schnuerera sp. xch1]